MILLKGGGESLGIIFFSDKLNYGEHFWYTQWRREKQLPAVAVPALKALMEVRPVGSLSLQ